MKNYTKLDELKSENAILKTKNKKLEEDLKYAKNMIKNMNEINLELIKKIYKKEK